MRIEAAGAQITDAVIEVLDTLQNQPELRDAYIAVSYTHLRAHET